MDLTQYNTNELIQNYIYISHLDEGLQYWYLPTSPDTIEDTMQSQFNSTTALGRSAPVYTFSNAGPRSVQISMKLHRDLMDDINIGRSNAELLNGEDYIENLVRALQSIALPKYNLTNKAVEPPLVAVRFAEQLFIKGVVTSSVGVTYSKPILYNNKYAELSVNFMVSEVDPYDATTVFKNGSLRGVVRTLKSGMNIPDSFGGV